MERFKKVITFVVILFAAGYAAIFCWLNIVQYVQHVDSDIAAEALLAREIWEERSLTPDNWISSTERRIISPATLGAIIYGVTRDMNLSMGIACILCGMSVMGAFIYLLRTAKISWLGVGTACLLVLCLPVNGIQVEGGMLPYFTSLVFLFAGYYTPHIVAMLLGLSVYLRLKRGEKSSLLIVLGGMCSVLVLALGASGMRCFQVVTAPLCILEILDLYRSSQRFTKKIPRKRLIASFFLAAVLVSNIFGMCYPSSVAYEMHILSADQVMEKLLYKVPAAILECMGIAGYMPLKSFGAVMQLGAYALAGITVFAYCFIRKHRAVIGETITLILDFFLYSLLFTVFVVSITSVEPYSYYFFICIFLASAAIGILTDFLEQRYHILNCVLLGGIGLYAVMNLQYTYIPAITITDNQIAYEEVVDFMKEEEIEYGYAQFWNANRLNGVSNGEITVGNVYAMQNLEMYWWLTNVNWYVPSLPEDMTTAYIVTWEEQDGFLAGIGERLSLEQAFSNEKFVVYTTDRNIVTR